MNMTLETGETAEVLFAKESEAEFGEDAKPYVVPSYREPSWALIYCVA